MDDTRSPDVPAEGAALPLPSDIFLRTLADTVQLLADLLLQPGWDGRGTALRLENAWMRILEQGTGEAPVLQAGGARLQDSLGRLGRSLAGELEVDYTRLFLHGRPVTAHPYESFYRTGQLCDPDCLAELGELFEAAGLQPAADDRIPPDHLGLELEFLATLLRALTDTALDPPARASIRALAAELLHAHLRPFAHAVSTRLDQCGPTEYFRQVAGCLTVSLQVAEDCLGQAAAE